jgi:hypothetical protein
MPSESADFLPRGSLWFVVRQRDVSAKRAHSFVLLTCFVVTEEFCVAVQKGRKKMSNQFTDAVTAKLKDFVLKLRLVGVGGK